MIYQLLFFLPFLNNTEWCIWSRTEQCKSIEEKKCNDIGIRVEEGDIGQASAHEAQCLKALGSEDF